MPLDLDTWKGLYNVFDPTRRLEESDQRLYVSRPGAVAEDVAADLRLGLTRQEQERVRLELLDEHRCRRPVPIRCARSRSSAVETFVPIDACALAATGEEGSLV